MALAVRHGLDSFDSYHPATKLHFEIQTSCSPHAKRAANFHGRKRDVKVFRSVELCSSNQRKGSVE